MAQAAAALSVAQVRRARFASLLLGPDLAGGRAPAEVVTWFGALQGQDLASVLWSVGLRTGTTRSDLDAELESGRIVRTWPMRGTLHLVPGADAAWMVRHLGARALAGAATRRATIGLTPEDAHRAVDLLGTALADTALLTRSQALAALTEAGIDTSGQRGYHLLWFVAQSGLIVSGPARGKEQTFALLADWVPNGSALDRDEALATIAGRFVRSHGPISARDLARWADLTLTDARAGLAANPDLAQVSYDGMPFWVTPEALDTAESGDLPARALPGFDELVLGYRDRSAQFDRTHEPLVVPGGNGVFRSTLVLDGAVVGVWRRTVRARSVAITATPFAALPARDREVLEGELTRYAAHLGLPPAIGWAEPSG